jgi:hypothetical protein
LSVRGILGITWAVLVRPDLWVTALRQLRLLAPTGWWRRTPFLPVPSRAYVAFRSVTQYGDPPRQPEVRDVIDYLEWCRDWHSTGRIRRG